MMSPHEIIESAMKMPDDQKALLVEKLVDSLNEASIAPEISEAWRLEVQRRMQQILDGTAETRPWEEVRDELDLMLSRIHEQ